MPSPTGPVRPADLDYTPLTRHVAWRARLRALRGEVRLVIGATIGALMVLIAGVVLVVLLAVGDLTADLGGLAVLVMVLLGGIYVVGDAAAQAAAPSALEDFAEANALQAIPAGTAVGYAAFAGGGVTLARGVRTRGRAFVEVGDRGVAESELYLRVRLHGRAVRRPEQADFLTPQLHDTLVALAGPFTVHLARGELTLLGSRPLDPRTDGRVRTALELAETLALRVDPTWLEGASAPSAAKAPTARPRRALTIVLGTVLTLIVLPLLIAVVMSSLEDRLRGDEAAAQAVVGLVVLVVLGVVGLLVRLATKPRR